MFSIQNQRAFLRLSAMPFWLDRAVAGFLMTKWCMYAPLYVLTYLCMHICVYAVEKQQEAERNAFQILDKEVFSIGR